MSSFKPGQSAVVSVAMIALAVLWADDAGAATPGGFALGDPESPAAALPAKGESVSLGTAVTLSILPGCGAGHYYADDPGRALTFLVLDGTSTAVFVSTFVLYATSVAPAFTKVALIAFPTVFVTVKVVQAIDVVDAVEVANNRTMRPVSLRHLPADPPALALFTF